MPFLSLQLLCGEEGRSPHACLAAIPRETNLGTLAHAWEHGAQRRLAHRLEQKLSGARDTPANRDNFWVEGVDRVRYADAEALAEHPQRLAGLLIARPRRLDYVPTAYPPPRCG